jgi:hypothetical protein
MCPSPYATDKVIIMMNGGEAAVMSAVVYLRFRFEEHARILLASIFSGGLAADRRGAVDHEGSDFHEGA